MIYGKRIRLRGVEKRDIPKFYEWINDPEVTEGLAIYLPMSMSVLRSEWDARPEGK